MIGSRDHRKIRLIKCQKRQKYSTLCRKRTTSIRYIGTVPSLMEVWFRAKMEMFQMRLMPQRGGGDTPLVLMMRIVRNSIPHLKLQWIACMSVLVYTVPKNAADLFIFVFQIHSGASFRASSQGFVSAPLGARTKRHFRALASLVCTIADLSDLSIVRTCTL